MDRFTGKVERIFSQFILYYINTLIKDFCVETEMAIMTHRF